MANNGHQRGEFYTFSVDFDFFADTVTLYHKHDKKEIRKSVIPQCYNMLFRIVHEFYIDMSIKLLQFSTFSSFLVSTIKTKQNNSTDTCTNPSCFLLVSDF